MLTNETIMNNVTWEEDITQQIPRLRRYARALTKNSTSADDLVQDCLERAWSKRDTWIEGNNLRAWLFTIMHNCFINGIRKQKRHDDYVNQISIPTLSHENNKQHIMHDLQTCLNQLKPESREVILLAGLENLSYKEISQITGAPIGTVMSRLSRGREELRRLMTEPNKPKLVSVK